MTNLKSVKKIKCNLIIWEILFFGEGEGGRDEIETVLLECGDTFHQTELTKLVWSLNADCDYIRQVQNPQALLDKIPLKLSNASKLVL